MWFWKLRERVKREVGSIEVKIDKACGWESEMEWGRESQRDAVTRGDTVFILVLQKLVDPGGCKGGRISIR